jgi:hypothetical protein
MQSSHNALTIFLVFLYLWIIVVMINISVMIEVVPVKCQRFNVQRLVPNSDNERHTFGELFIMQTFQSSDRLAPPVFF